MKNKKLFAILTLVCFMFTLMPVAAFAADPADVTPAFGSIPATFTNVETGDMVKVDISKDPANAGKIAGVKDGFVGYYIYATQNDELAKVKKHDADKALTAVGDAVGLPLYKTTTTSNIFLTFDNPGEYTINIAGYTDAIDKQVDAKIKDYTGSADVMKYVKTFPIAMANATVKVSAADDAKYTVSLWEDTTDPADGVADKALTKVVLDADNGYSSKVVYAKVTRTVKAGIVTVAGADVELVADSHAVKITKLDNATVAGGFQKFLVTADIPGDFTLYATYENAPKVDVPVVVNPANAVEVSVLAEPKAPVDKKDRTADDTGILFEISDATGYEYEDLTGIDYKVTITEAPATFVKPNVSSLKLVWGSHNDVEGFEVYNADGKALKLTKEGKYTFKVALKNGSTATASVTVGDFDEAVSIALAKVPATVVVDTNTFKVFDKQVIALDANGVSVEAASAKANLGTVTVSAHGSAVESFERVQFNDKAEVVKDGKAYNGYLLTVKEDDKYVATTITLIAVAGTGSDALTATHEVVVTEAADTVVYEDAEVAAGEMATLYANVVDADGKVVNMAGGKVQVIVLDKPENAIASVRPVATIDSKGKVEVDFLASASGEYKIQTIVTKGGKYISGIETITVGGIEGTFNDVVVISMGANSMIVNNELVKLDVAPFIENGRTMLQYNVLYVFGIDVNWVPETSSVVAEGNGTKVVMTLGSKVATVNGEEVTLDVAPYVVNGRTVVPVGLITGVFDINFDFTRNADGTIADILFTK